MNQSIPCNNSSTCPAVALENVALECPAANVIDTARDKSHGVFFVKGIAPNGQNLVAVDLLRNMKFFLAPASISCQQLCYYVIVLAQPPFMISRIVNRENTNTSQKFRWLNL